MRDLHDIIRANEQAEKEAADKRFREESRREFAKKEAEKALETEKVKE